MKKITILLSAAILAFTIAGCGKEAKKISTAYGIQSPVNGISWGMSKEDVIAVMGNEYEEKTDPKGRNETMTFQDPVTAFGKSAKITVSFLINRKEGEEDAIFPNLDNVILDSISLTFSSGDGKAVEKEVEEKFGPSKEKYFNIEGSRAYVSRDTIGDIEEADIRGRVLETGKKYLNIEDEGSSGQEETLLESRLNAFYTVADDTSYTMHIMGGKVLYIVDAEAGIQKDN